MLYYFNFQKHVPVKQITFSKNYFSQNYFSTRSNMLQEVYGLINY